MKAKKIFVPLGIIASGIIILGVLGSMAPKPKKKSANIKAPLVEVFEVIREDRAFVIESQGSVVPRTQTTLVSEVAGVIKNVSDKFVAGGFFKAGELILEIDPISYEVALLQAQARLDAANARLAEEIARGKQAEKEWSMTGRDKNSAPILALRKPQLQQAKAEVKAAEADVKNAEIKLQRTKIVAPYDAMIKSKMTDVGQFVSTGSQLAVTFAVDYAEVRLPIKEQDYPFIDVPSLGELNNGGAEVILKVNQSGNERIIKSRISRGEGVVDSKSRVNYVVAQIDDPYAVFKNESEDNQTESKDSDKNSSVQIGMFVTAEIIGKQQSNVIAVPRRAVRGANTLYLLNQGQLQIRHVPIIYSDTEFVYMTDGVESGEKIVLTKLSSAIEGMKLRLPGDKAEALPEDGEQSEKQDDAVADAN